MALARPKLTIFFEHGKYGWSENWYLPGNAYEYDTAADVGLEYISRRKEALGYGAVISYLRVSDDTALRDSFVKVISEKDGMGSSPNSNTYRAEDSNTAVLHRVEAGAARRRSWMVAGLPDGDVDQGFPLGFDPGAPGIIAIKKLGVWMVQRQFGIKVKTGVNTYAYQAITSVQAVRAASRRRGRPFGSPVGRR